MGDVAAAAAGITKENTRGEQRTHNNTTSYIHIYVYLYTYVYRGIHNTSRWPFLVMCIYVGVVLYAHYDTEI